MLPSTVDLIYAISLVFIYFLARNIPGANCSMLHLLA